MAGLQNHGRRRIFEMIKQKHVNVFYTSSSVMLSHFRMGNSIGRQKQNMHVDASKLELTGWCPLWGNARFKLAHGRLLSNVFKNSIALIRTFPATYCDDRKIKSKQSETFQIQEVAEMPSDQTKETHLDSDFTSYLNEIRKEFGHNTSDDHLNNDSNENVAPKRTNVEAESVSKTQDKGIFTESSDVKENPGGMQEKYVPYDDVDAEVILDEEEIYETLERGETGFYVKEEHVDELSSYNLSRGITGVFDIEELVEVLNKENLQDICVISVPEEKNYADYLVITTCRSGRHSSAVSELMKKLHKRKKHKSDPFIKIEGDKCSEWKAIDLGNIVVHVFMPQTRLKYDIETLWTVGEEFDELFNKADELFEAIQKHSFDFAEFKPLA